MCEGSEVTAGGAVLLKCIPKWKQSVDLMLHDYCGSASELHRQFGAGVTRIQLKEAVHVRRTMAFVCYFVLHVSYERLFSYNVPRNCFAIRNDD